MPPSEITFSLSIAGVTGLLYAVAATSHAGNPPVLCLRNINPYVAAALGSTCAEVPRQRGPAPNNMQQQQDTFSGTVHI
jgi:hypothetical protein